MGGAVALAAVSLLGSAGTASAATANPPAYGNDISFPQCPRGMGRGGGLPYPSGSPSFVILGVNEGSSGFTRNPCLARQVAWARDRHLWTGVYTVPGYPKPAQLTTYGTTGPYGSKTLTARLSNVGYAEARATIATMRAAGLAKVPTVWLDVEHPPLQPWSKDTAGNVAVLRGVVKGYTAAGYRVGVYSYAYGWREIAGSWRPGLPLWATAGPTSRSKAQAKCSQPSFLGGSVPLAQWYTTSLDYDVTCPGVTDTPLRHDALYPYRGTVVRYDSRGAAVSALQRRLGVTPVSGWFGPRTRAAVVAFQDKHHLRVDGIVGAATWRALGAYRMVPGPSQLPRYFVRF